MKPNKTYRVEIHVSVNVYERDTETYRSEQIQRVNCEQSSEGQFLDSTVYTACKNAMGVAGQATEELKELLKPVIAEPHTEPHDNAPEFRAATETNAAPTQFKESLEVDIPL